jgi:hypothetical protein
VRLAILDKDLGRIKIAIVTRQAALDEGGVKGLADAIDQRLRVPGTLVVIAGDNAWVTTSYDRPQAAALAVRRAFARDGNLAGQLLAAVDGIARIDPGPGGDLEGTQPVASREIDDAAQGFLDTIQLIFWIVGLVIALPFLFGAFVLVRALWRSSRQSREAVGDQRSDANDELVALGDQIRELDSQAGTFESDLIGQAAYERALGAYERAERLLPAAASPRRLARVRLVLAQGQSHIAAARARLGVESPAAAPAPAVDAQHDEANKAFGRD